MYRSVRKLSTGSNKSNGCNESNGYNCCNESNGHNCCNESNGGNCCNESNDCNEIQKALKGVSMKKVLAFFAEGTEEIECLMVVDILRRAGVSVELIAVAPDKLVKGSHQITILCDKNISELTENDFSAADLLFLPGGIPGVPHLEENKSLLEALQKQFQAGKDLAAICAAPGIFGRLGFLKGQHFTCYPGFEEGISDVDGAKWSGKAVEVGKQIITGRGMGVALDFALALVERLEGAEKAAQLKKGVQHPECI